MKQTVRSRRGVRQRLIRNEEKEGDLMLIKPNCNTSETNPAVHSPCLEDSSLGLFLK